MPPVDRIGTFQGEIKDFGVAKTSKKELPQFIVTLLATKIYDDVNEVWEDWSEFEQTITGYFVLVTTDDHGKPVKCLNYDQVMEAVGWDGETFSSLAAMALKGKTVQFRVQEDTYDGNTILKANWIAAADAELGLRKLTGKDLTDLDAKFQVGSSKKPATAATPKKVDPSTSTKTTKKKTAEAPKPPAAPKPPKAGKPAESCSEEDAYQACFDANEKLGDKAVPEDILNDYWIAEVQKIAVDVDNITDEESAKIRDAVLESIHIPF